MKLSELLACLALLTFLAGLLCINRPQAIERAQVCRQRSFYGHFSVVDAYAEMVNE